MLEALKRLVASRKAIIAFLGAAVAVAVHFVPELEPLKGDGLAFVEAGLALLATLIAIEDSAEKLGAQAAALSSEGAVDAAKVEAKSAEAVADAG